MYALLWGSACRGVKEGALKLPVLWPVIPNLFYSMNLLLGLILSLCRKIKQQILLLVKKGIGVLITDHNVRETLAICHRATIVSEGVAIASGTPAEILANTQVRSVYLGEEFTL